MNKRTKLMQLIANSDDKGIDKIYNKIYNHDKSSNISPDDVIESLAAAVSQVFGKMALDPVIAVTMGIITNETIDILFNEKEDK